MAMLNVADGKQIYFEYYPGDKLPVMLIHGWGTHCRVWDTTLTALQDAGHAVVTFDQRGCGRSDKDFQDVSIGAAADDAAALAETLDIQKLVVNGWSLGGAIAVATAHRLGDRCAGVVLTAGATPRYTQAADFPYGNPPGSTAETVKLMRADRVNFLMELSKAVFAQPPSEATLNWTLSAFMEAAPSADLALAELDTLDQRDILAGIAAPVLSIVGGKDLIAAPDIGRQAADCASNGRVEEFPDSGHAPFIEEGPRYREVVLKFLDTLK
ncbi:MAG: alpha/beta hydrolase [Ectothiorhodospiraceae bacterium]|nr:alpha/beta hydrolase [Ectothiorhodospiraceae bacterium]TVQ46817.1 MAG: alpha/beta hydrolase [Gammaproteobacteria bacterium]